MRYTYICDVCGPYDSDTRADWSDCMKCYGIGRRDWGFHVDTSFEPYFAPSFGQVVNSRTHAKDLAKIASEEATLRTGVEAHYEVVDTHDDAAVGINTEEKKAAGEETRRRAVNGAAWSQERVKEIEASRPKRKVDA